MKNYRILKTMGMHFASIHKMYDRRPEIKRLPYEEQMEFFRKSRMVHFNSFAHYMKNLGNEAWDIVYDFEELQKAWAKEKGVSFRTKHWKQDIFLKQIEYYKPDVLYLQDIHALSVETRRELKRIYPFIKLIVVYRCSGLEYPDFSDIDLLFAGAPIFYDYYKDKVFKTHLLYHSFDDTIYRELKNEAQTEATEPQDYPFTFAGSSGYGFGAYHHTRYWGLIELLKKTPIQLWVDDRLEKKAEYEKAKPLFPKAFRQMEPITELYPERCHEFVFGMDMYRVLYHSQITLNIHTPVGINNVGNMRMFEATGVGCCLFTDTASNMADLFDADKEVVTFTSIEECIEKWNYLSTRADERKQIAQAGRNRILKEHTLEKRCGEIHDVISGML